MAVASLVLGIVGLVTCFLFIAPVLAVIFGLVAAGRIKRSNGAVTGAGKARAGWILGIVGLVVGAGFWALAATGAFDDDGVALDELEVGMCATVSDLDDEVTSIPVVECDEPHDAEVIGLGEANPGGGGEYPGIVEVNEIVNAECVEDFADYVGADPDSELAPTFVFPNEENWTEADGNYVCFAYTQGGDELTASVRNR